MFHKVWESPFCFWNGFDPTMGIDHPYPVVYVHREDFEILSGGSQFSNGLPNRSGPWPPSGWFLWALVGFHLGITVVKEDNPMWGEMSQRVFYVTEDLVAQVESVNKDDIEETRVGFEELV